MCAAGDVGRHRVFDLLSGLATKSLVLADTGDPAPRYRLLETVRSYAREGLVAAGELDEVRQRHASWCVQLIEQGIRTDDGAAWILDNQEDEDNLRAALAWSLEDGRAELALRLVKGLMLFWEGSGCFSDAREWLRRALAGSESAPAELRAVALHDIGFVAFMLGDFDAARAHLWGSLALWAEVGDPIGSERTQGLLAFVSTFGAGSTSVEELEDGLRT
jgi:hypothetical protein